MGGGLENRFFSIANESVSASEMFDKLKTKRYTDAKLRRAMLFCMTGVKTDDIRQLPEYTLLLGASSAGRALLASNRREQRIRVVTKPADAPDNTRQYVLSSRLESLWGLARQKKLPADSAFKKSAYIKKDE